MPSCTTLFGLYLKQSCESCSLPGRPKPAWFNAAEGLTLRAVMLGEQGHQLSTMQSFLRRRVFLTPPRHFQRKHLALPLATEMPRQRSSLCCSHVQEVAKTRYKLQRMYQAHRLSPSVSFFLAFSLSVSLSVSPSLSVFPYFSLTHSLPVSHGLSLLIGRYKVSICKCAE